jgi:regulator of protease activity HflC (stomatin/prohibitin superfamily)
MHKDCISNWNNEVSATDEVFILGDVSFGTPEETADILDKLNGIKHLVLGNHDKNIFRSQWTDVRRKFASINHYLEKTLNGTHIVMFHYPIAEFNKQHRGSVHFHGHVHGTYIQGVHEYRSVDVAYDATGKWGVRVNRVEIKAIDPPPSVQESMEKQMRAERDKRAAILTAEGEKQSQILTAEGARQAEILRAEGDAQAAVLRADGEAAAIKLVFDAVHAANPDEKVLAYQYLQQLPAIANGTASKIWVIPAELSGGVEQIMKAFKSK